jgi:hypothetical protein
MRRIVLSIAAAALLALPGCMMHHLARTVGAGNGELSASVGGPMMSNLGFTIPIPNLVVNGRVGATDGFDVVGGVSVTGLFYETMGLHLGGVAQVVRERNGLAVSVSGHGHLLVGFRGPDARFFPEVGLHLEGMAAPWLSLYGGLFSFVQFEPPQGKPPIFVAPYLGAELLFGGSDEAGHPFGVALEGGWVSPWQSSVSVISWEPANTGAMYVQLGFRARFGGLDR